MKNIDRMIEILGFTRADIIELGPYFKQASRKVPSEGKEREGQGLQIDLMIHRRGRIVSLLECKFSESPVESSVIAEVERKVKELRLPRTFSIERILITASGVSPSVEERDYFHRIITLDEMLISG